MLNEKYGDYTITVNDTLTGYKLIKHRTTKKGEDADSIIGHFNSLTSCIQRLAELNAMQKPTLKEYIKEYKTVIEDFKIILG